MFCELSYVLRICSTFFEQDWRFCPAPLRAIRYAHRARITPASAMHLRQNRMTSRHSLFSGSANRVNVLPNCCECSRYSQHTPRNTNHLHAEVIVFLTNLPICRFRDLCQAQIVKNHLLFYTCTTQYNSYSLRSIIIECSKNAELLLVGYSLASGRRLINRRTNAIMLAQMVWGDYLAISVEQSETLSNQQYSSLIDKNLQLVDNNCLNKDPLN